MSGDGPRIPRQRKKSFSEPHYEDGSRVPAIAPRQVATERQDHSVHDRATGQPTIRKQHSFDPNVCALQSKNVDYVNMPQTAPQDNCRDVAATRWNGRQQLKAPKQPPRACSVDSGSGGPSVPLSSQPVSMPAALHSGHDSRGGDISDRIGIDIQSKAAEVVDLGRDEGEYTLSSSIPFDPYLECLYCNLQFRYGEIQKYRKHVLDCSGGSTV